MTDQRHKYQGKVVTVDVEMHTLPDGHEHEVEIIRHPGGAAIVALDTEQRVCLLRQYRYVTGDWLWELPAGKLEQGETALETAQRELTEEAGVIATSWVSLGEIWPSPGVLQEKVSLFLARDLTSCETNHEQTEVMEIHWIPLQQALIWSKNNQIQDAKTIVGLHRVMTN